MSQASILAYLKANPGWHRSKDIAAALGLSTSAASRAVTLLFANHEIERREMFWPRSKKGGGVMMEYRAVVG